MENGRLLDICPIVEIRLNHKLPFPILTYQHYPIPMYIIHCFAPLLPNQNLGRILHNIIPQPFILQILKPHNPNIQIQQINLASLIIVSDIINVQKFEVFYKGVILL